MRSMRTPQDNWRMQSLTKDLPFDEKVKLDSDIEIGFFYQRETLGQRWASISSWQKVKADQKASDLRKSPRSVRLSADCQERTQTKSSMPGSRGYDMSPEAHSKSLASGPKGSGLAVRLPLHRKSQCAPQ